MPTPADLFAFVIIFFPGYISLSIAVRLHDIPAEKIGSVEKAVISFALSIASFFLARVPLDPAAPAATVLSFRNLTLVFLVAAGLGLVVAVLYYAWVYVEFKILGAANWVRVRLGLTLSPGTALKDALDLLWDNRDKNYVVVMDKSGQMFRGFLGMLSLEPNAQLMLSQHDGRKPEKFDNGTWKAVDEWALVFVEDNIRWIGAGAR
ncbi:MAG: DUF6338 family protein [Candidatus Bathyarchaeia archaeon]